MTYYHKQNNYNQYLIRIPDNIICIDTDTEEVYNTLIEQLEENYLYDEDSRTESFSGRGK